LSHWFDRIDGLRCVSRAAKARPDSGPRFFLKLFDPETKSRDFHRPRSERHQHEISTWNQFEAPHSFVRRYVIDSALHARLQKVDTPMQGIDYDGGGRE
jgi:hypothetical protein